MTASNRLPSDLADLDGAEERTENVGRVAGQVQRMRVVYDYVHGTPRSIVEEMAAKRSHGLVVLNYFARAMAMARSLARLDEPTDYQLVMAGVRSLFEMVVDMTLINGGNHALDKLALWEESARLENAEAMQRRKTNKPTYKMPAEVTNYLAKIDPAIQAGREQHWRKPAPSQQPKPRKSSLTCAACAQEDARRAKKAAEKAAEPTPHPERWTSHTLKQDAEEADKLPGAGDLVDFYFTMNKLLCWGTHGTGAVGLKYMSTAGFPAWHWVPMGMAVQLVLRVTQLCLDHFGCFDQDAEKAAVARGWELYEAAFVQRLGQGPDRVP